MGQVVLWLHECYSLAAMPASTLEEKLHPSLERILVLKNPVSKNSARGKRQLEDLVEYSGLHMDTVETARDPAVTQDRLEALEPTDLLYTIGGDGTINQAIGPLSRRRALLLPSRSGNANDLAMSLNGRKAPWQIYSDYLSGKAKVAAVHPIEVSIKSSAGVETAHANNYVSFGYAALASYYLNQPRPPTFNRAVNALTPRLRTAARIPMEGYLLGKAAMHAKPFDYTSAETDVVEEVVDASVVRSERMAKFGRFNIRHADTFLFASKLTETGVLAMGNQFVKMMRAKTTGKYVTDIAFRAVNTSGMHLYYQVDGEAFPLPEVSNVSVGLAQSPIRVLSTRLG